jgi:hypothetical protein
MFRKMMPVCSLVLGLVFLAVPAAAPGGVGTQTVDLYQATSRVVYDKDPFTAEGLATAKVVTPAGGLIPYPTGTLAQIETVMRVNQRTSIIGKVDPTTGQPVGAVAINKNPCDAGDLGNWDLCIGVEYYHAGNGENLSALSVSLNDYRTPTQCDGSPGVRYFNVWKNISTLDRTFGYDDVWIHCVNIWVEQWYAYDGTDKNYPTNTRFHPTASDYNDALHGHPIVYLNAIWLLGLRFRRRLMQAVENLRLAA